MGWKHEKLHTNSTVLTVMQIKTIKLQHTYQHAQNKRLQVGDATEQCECSPTTGPGRSVSSLTTLENGWALPTEFTPTRIPMRNT